MIPARASSAEAAPEPAAFLDVESSLTGRRWRLRSYDDRVALAMAQRLGLPEIVGRVLAARGAGLDLIEDCAMPSNNRCLVWGRP